MYKKINYIIIVIVSFLLTSCSDHDVDSNVYRANESMNDMDTYACTVVNKRAVRVSASGDSNNDSTGAVVGSIAGGVIGNSFGSGGGRVLMTALGALGGAAAGSAVQRSAKNSNKKIAYEYTVKLDINGQLKTVVQGTQVVLRRGERAYLVSDRSRATRSRLIPME